MVVRLDRGFVWTPRPSYRLYGSVLLNGQEVKFDVLDCSLDMAVIGTTSKACSCTIKINNAGGAYTGLFSKKDTVKIYADYSTGATQQFDGFIREVNPGIDGFPYLEIIGNDWAGEALMRTVNKQYSTAQTLDTIFKDLVSNYLPGHTTTNVADMSTLGTFVMTFNNKLLIDCFRDIMTKTEDNYCAYCDFSKDWHVFEKGLVFNLYEPIIHTRNLIRIGTEDTLSNMSTRITLYGKDQEGMPMMVTVSDDPEGVGNIHNVYKDTNISTYDDLVEKANALLAQSKTSEVNCKQAVVKGMIGLKPGDSVYMFAPMIGLQGEVFVSSYKHDIQGGKVMKTTCQWQIQHKVPTDLAMLIKDRIDENQEILDISNPDDLENSYNFTFSDESNVETFTNTTVKDTSGNYNGKLQLSAGYSTGSMISSTRTTTTNVTKTELKYSGWDLGDSVFEVSVDGGLNYQTLTIDTVLNIGYSGNSLKIRVILNSTAGNPSPNIESMVLLYT